MIDFNADASVIVGSNSVTSRNNHCVYHLARWVEFVCYVTDEDIITNTSATNYLKLLFLTLSSPCATNANHTLACRQCL